MFSNQKEMNEKSILEPQDTIDLSAFNNWQQSQKDKASNINDYNSILNDRK
jgi:hypothetical protein